MAEVKIDAETALCQKVWQEKRAHLNHDILCNQVRIELYSLQTKPGSMMPVRLPQFLHREGEFRSLLRDAPAALSSTFLLDESLFACWPLSKRERMRPVFHRLFLLSTGIDESIARLEALLNSTLIMAEQFLQTPQESRSKAQVSRLIESLEGLSEGLSSLAYV